MKGIILYFFLVILLGCSKGQDKKETILTDVKNPVIEKDSSIKEDRLEKKIEQDTIFDFETYLEHPKELNTIFKRVQGLENSSKTTEEEFYGDSNCIRNIPLSLIKSDDLILHNFVLNDSLQVGEEIAILDNGDSLYLVNKGCEYYWVEYWYSAGKTGKLNETAFDSLFIQSINDIGKVDDSPINFDDWLSFIKSEIDSGRHIQLKNEYFLDDSGINKSFTVSNLTETSDRAIIRFDYSIGPL